ncbi:hypothetical protein OSB04_010218 [Centaurea solstitialis]|uniref:CCT domain-containing protein n=1 Tax=Centaurea solstitialis TaxID=347529 RepID=A0AA38WMX0_9ASTR|nr:hypothetical protein OSB04_010218 [Centaurea solstitialis]
MLDDPFLPSEQLQPSMEKVPSPLSGQILEFCESELFPDTLQNLEVASTSNCCYQDHDSSFPMDINAIGTTTTTKPPPTTATNSDTNNNLSIIFEDDDINYLDFTTSPSAHLQYQFGHHQDQFDLTLLPFPLTTDHINSPILPYPHPHPTDHVVPVMGPTTPFPLPLPLPLLTEDDCSMPPSKLMRFNNPNSPPNYSFMDPSLNSYLSGNSNPPLESYGNNLFMGNEIQSQLQGDIFSTDPLPPPPPYNNSNELQIQALSNESQQQQHVVNGGSGSSSGTPLASEITSLEPETLRVANKLTTEERKEKIHRYMKKRNQRNFSKKIKYACRKTLADSRPRVRGRFAKNDEFGDNINRSTNHEEDTDEDVKSFHVVVKEEEDHHLESSDIFAHISGMNSFKCNYPTIQSWI